MADSSEFEMGTDQISFTTKTNGDRIEIKNVHLGAEEAAKLALLINSGVPLKCEISEA